MLRGTPLGAVLRGTPLGAVLRGTPLGAVLTDIPAGVMLNDMPSVRVNGADEDVATGTTVADVVDRWCASRDGIAVARNGDVVPRSSWTATAVEAGDRLEIVTAAAGG